MEVRFVTPEALANEEQPTVNFPPGYEYDNMLSTGFIDTGGSVDFACLTKCRTDISKRIIYITGAMYWKLSEKENILFATIRNQMAILHLQNKFHLLGCETNNYGKNEMESLRRDYGIKMIGIHTGGKLTDPKKIAEGKNMDKNAIVKFVNSWRQNAIADPENIRHLGQIKFLKKKTRELVQLKSEFESFVRKMPEGIGATGQPKYGAEGTGHDDGVMSTLGHIHMIKTIIFKIYTGTGSVGAVPQDSFGRPPSMKRGLAGRSIGRVDDSRFDVI